MVVSVNHCGNFYVQNMMSVINVLTSYSEFSDVSRQRFTDMSNTLPLTAVKRKNSKWINPKVIAFDLDCTLWPFWVDTHVTPPFRLNEDGVILDARRRHISCFPGVLDVLKELHSRGIKLAAVSRTSEITGAKQLVELFGFKKYFDFIEIYPGSKILHFSKIARETDIDYSDMIFFDDEFRNIADIKKLGVFTIYCPDGVSPTLVDATLVDYDRSRREA